MRAMIRTNAPTAAPMSADTGTEDLPCEVLGSPVSEPVSTGGLVVGEVVGVEGGRGVVGDVVVVVFGDASGEDGGEEGSGDVPGSGGGL